jgi:hypothetical protein
MDLCNTAVASDALALVFIALADLLGEGRTSLEAERALLRVILVRAAVAVAIGSSRGNRMEEWF